MLASCFVDEEDDDVAATVVALVVVVRGADVVTTFDATAVVAVLDEAVGAADVTGPAVVMVEFWFDRQMPGTWRGFFSGVLQQSGDRTHLLSALRGWSRSGERARRRSGELGSAVFARGKPFLVGGVGEPPRATIPGTIDGGATLEALGRTPGL